MFARPPNPAENNRKMLTLREKHFTILYDPPCNNETPSGVRGKAAWIAANGREPILIRRPRGR